MILIMKHSSTVRNFTGTSVQLAEEIGDLYYNALAELLGQLAAKMAADSAADSRRGRPRLAGELAACAEHLKVASQHIQSAWAICAPHVREPRE
jgi:hypothetical protein